MAHPSSSPSARFYAHRSTPNSLQMDQPFQSVAATEALRAHHTEPFGQFQGFSSSSTRHGDANTHFDEYGYRVQDGDVSPRMRIPNAVPWESRRPQVQTLIEHHEESPHESRIYQSCKDFDSERSFDVITEQFEPATQQYAPPHHYAAVYPPTPPHIYMSLPVPSQHLHRGYHSGTSPPPVSTGASRHANTFRVPSDSEPGQFRDNLDSPPFDALSDVLKAEEETVSMPSSTLGEGASTIYPEDSVSTASRNGAYSNALPPKTLSDIVVEIHDICLAATQRYLGTLRVNWDLRNGRPIGGEDAAQAVGVRLVQGHDRGRGKRWAPYKEAGSRRRARSESHLEHMAMGSNRQPRQDGDRHHSQRLARKNPIPYCTNSLLHNIRHICELIWRRAQRDRVDVLGAEAKGYRDMSFLNECGETVVLYGVTDAERDPQGCFHRVVAAGTGICRELRDWEGMRLMGHGQGAGACEG